MTLVELAAVICVVGIVLAVFVPTFVRELRTSKTSEAAEHLALLYRRSAAYFAVERPTESGAPNASCLPPTAGPTPRAPTQDARRVEFGGADTPGSATWSALGFEPEVPVRYSYSFEPTAAGCRLRSPEDTFLVTFRAEGDLDGDGERSVFERRAAAADGRLVPFGFLYTRDRAE